MQFSMNIQLSVLLDIYASMHVQQLINADVMY